MSNESDNNFEHLFKEHINMNKMNNWIKYIENASTPITRITFPTLLKKEMFDMCESDKIASEIEEFVSKYLDESYKVFRVTYGLTVKKKNSKILKILNISKSLTIDTLLSDNVYEDSYGYIIEIRKKQIVKSTVIMEYEEFKVKYKEGTHKAIFFFLCALMLLPNIFLNSDQYIPNISFIFTDYAGFILIFLYFFSRGVCKYLCDIAMYFYFKFQMNLLSPFKLGFSIGLISMPLALAITEVIVTIGWR